ncbi:hypothetical protein Sros01_03290 [Streptomyces roseochromogenus]|nr:hypothetical protein Sros01_03290 [Streptomyces roseochromogenus]
MVTMGRVNASSSDPVRSLADDWAREGPPLGAVKTSPYGRAGWRHGRSADAAVPPVTAIPDFSPASPVGPAAEG